MSKYRGSENPGQTLDERKSKVAFALNINNDQIISLEDGLDMEDQLPATQPVDDRVLKDVVAYVEVRSTNDNRSKAICRELVQLGAVVAKTFTDDVTHVVLKEGSKVL